MKYIRTKDTIYQVVDENNLVYRVKGKRDPATTYSKSKKNTEIISGGDTIEELCDEFIFEETNEIWAAAQIKDGDAVVLVCTYNNQSDYYEIKAKELIKVTFPDFREIETIHTFEENYSFDQGLDYFYSNFCK